MLEAGVNELMGRIRGKSMCMPVRYTHEKVKDDLRCYVESNNQILDL